VTVAPQPLRGRGDIGDVDREVERAAAGREEVVDEGHQRRHRPAVGGLRELGPVDEAEDLDVAHIQAPRTVLEAQIRRVDMPGKPGGRVGGDRGLHVGNTVQEVIELR